MHEKEVLLFSSPIVVWSKAFPDVAVIRPMIYRNGKRLSGERQPNEKSERRR
jgi:hypothetical protein